MIKNNVIQLDKNFRIEPDTYSWKLVKKVNKEVEVTEKTASGGRRKTGETVMKEIEEAVYFPSLNLCIKDYIEKSTKPCPVFCLNTLIFLCLISS